MNVGVLGINHKLASLETREKIIAFCQKQFPWMRDNDCESTVLLTTCNRCEIYFSGPSLHDTHSKILATITQALPDHFEQKCYTFFGYDCFVHLAKVTLGLDSAIPFETEIQGQVKQAYETAKSSALLNSELHFLFQKTLQLGKEIRSQLNTLSTAQDLEHIIFLTAKDFFLKHSRNLESASLLLIGCSEINLKVAKYLIQKGVKKIYFCNRTHEKATYFAETLSTHILEWDKLAKNWDNFDWVIAGAKSPTYLLNTPRLDLDYSSKLLIDLAVPRNINPEIISQNDTLLNIDELYTYLNEKKAHLEHTIKYAELRLLEACARKISAKKSKEAYAKELCLVE